MSNSGDRVQLALFDDMKAALISRDPETIASLVKLGADVNQTDLHGNTALIRAAIGGDTALAQLLIGKDADLERKNMYGNTALLLATVNRRPEIVRLLIIAGVDIDMTDNDHVREYGSPLWWAEKKNFTEIAEMLRDAPGLRRRQQLAQESAAAAKLKAQHDAISLKQEALKDKARQRRPKIQP